MASSWTRQVVASVVVVGAGLVACGDTALAVRLPIEMSVCSTGSFGAVAAAGMTFNTNSERFAVMDTLAAEVFLVDSACNLDSSFSLTTLGIDSASAIAHDAANARYAIVDGQGLLLVDEVGALLGQCDLAALGIVEPTAIAFNSASAQYVVIDDASDDASLIEVEVDGACSLDTRVDVAGAGLTSAVSMTYLADARQYAAIDAAAGKVLLLDASFALQDEFDTAGGIGAVAAVGLAYLAARDRFYLVDGEVDRLIEVDARGTSELKCPHDVSLPRGVAFNPETEEIAIVDEELLAVHIIDAPSCTPVRLIDLAAFGITDPEGITYRAPADQLVVAQHTQDPRLFLLDYENAQLESTCRTDRVGLTGLTGLTWVPEIDWLATGNQLAYAFVKPNCDMTHQHSTSLIADLGQSIGVVDFAFNPGAGTLLFLDLASVFVLNFEGLSEHEFATPPAQGSFRGLTRARGGDTFYALTSDAVYEWRVPLLEEPVSLSGLFVTPTGITVVLFERGSGHLSGALNLAGAELPVFGRFDAARKTVAFSFRRPSGSVVTLAGSVSPDLSEIALPPPLGTLTRRY